ncbi:MAG: hypothetical protein GY718_01830 [Lentisphaerae bacterium]|nr:hypothetical protein [Lentisphaerota bacterium]
MKRRWRKELAASHRREEMPERTKEREVVKRERLESSTLPLKTISI